MTKFYTLALAAAVAATASAMPELTLHTGVIQKERVETPAIAKKATPFKMEKFRTAPATHRAAAADESIYGDYTLTLGDYYFESSLGVIEIDATISEVEPGIVSIESPSLATNVLAAYDEETQTLTFVKIDGGPTGNYYLRVEPFEYVYDSETEGHIEMLDSFSVTYAGGTITFPVDHGISWSAYVDADYTTFAGYFELYDFLSMVKLVETDPDEGWTSVGTATFTDPWLMPAVGYTDTDEMSTWPVELQQNDDDANVYRLVDPYHGESPLSMFNESTKPGYIQFDITDPDHVVFALVKSGFSSSQLGLSNLYCYDVLTAYILQYSAYGYAPADIIGILGDDVCYTTFADGVVTIGSKEITDPATNETYTEYAACFTNDASNITFYSWNDGDGNAVPMTGKIVFPETTGIASVAAENAPVRYYNLQGVEVARPEAGQLVIRRHGSKATKLIVR